MFIGYIENAKYEYRRAGCDIPCEPERDPEDGSLFWDWKRLHSSALDINVDLGEECYVGTVSIDFTGFTKLHKVEVLDGKRVVGVHSAETGKIITTIDPIAVGETLRKLTVRIYDAMSTVRIADMRIAVAKDDGAPLLWPTPTGIRFGNGLVRPGKISVSADGCDELCKSLFSELLSEKIGVSPISPDGAEISFILDTGYPEERLSVSVTHEIISVRAGGRLALLRGACILVSAADKSGKIPTMELDDTPTLPMRGYHIGIPSRENIPFVKRLIKYMLLPLGYNQLFVQFCGGMRYDRHPEITEGWLQGNRLAREGKSPRFPHDYMGAEGDVLEKWEVAELLDYARELGFEIIPEVQSLGHVQYLTYSHPEIGELDENEEQVKDTREEDLRPDQKFIHCYCPSNELSYKLIFDIIDEVIEVAKPQRYLHIGHDEVYHLGLCPRCRKKSHTELFTGDVMKLYEYLRSKGLGTMMWGDMLQPVTKYDTKESINILPKDIIQLDFIWYFHMDKNIEDNLLEAGYKVLLGNLYSSHFPRYRERALKDGVLGGQISTWCAPNEKEMAERGKLWDTIFTAQLLMRPDLFSEDMRAVYSHVIAHRIQPTIRDLMRGKYNPQGYDRKALALSGGSRDALPDYLLRYRADARIADGATVLVNGCYDRLCLEVTTLNVGLKDPWSSPSICGHLTLLYNDGTEHTLPVGYTAEVQHINRRYGDPHPEAAHRHYGYQGTWLSQPTLETSLEDGKRLLLTEYILENPYPGKPIATISYKKLDEDFTGVVLCSAHGLNPKK